MVGAAVVAVAALAVAVALIKIPGHNATTAAARAATPPQLTYRDPGSESARQVLTGLARRAAGAPDRTGTGRYAYVETEGWYLLTTMSSRGVTSAVVPVTEQRWQAPDGSGRVRKEPGTPYFPTARDHAEWERDGRPEPGDSDDRSGRGGLRMTWTPASLSTDPDRLRAQLDAGDPDQDGDIDTLAEVGELNREVPLRPAVNAAELEMLAGVPGIRYDGATTDRAGRGGVAVSLAADRGGVPERYTLIFDPATGRLLDAEETLTGDARRLNVPVPSVISYTLYLVSVRTDRLSPPRS